ncbi:MAG: beta-N-acetylhexosaminidase [Lentisphaerae bacterium]|nr:beta-N-acetylhexosaminidase [Lentisphaerota bacterium]
MASSNKWTWDRQNTPGNINCALDSLRELWDLDCNDSTAKKLVFEAINADEVTSEVEYTAEGAIIRYNTLNAALRGVGSAISGIAGRQSTPFTMLGIMVDLSRNLVFKTDAMIKIFRRLAILGFNTVLLYCEDTYELPDEPAFGVMRGRYSAEEIRLMDDAAAAVGVELIGCIQTLGHMDQVLRWSGAYSKVTDTVGELRVDVPETHQLIGKMLDFWSQNLRSRRIHVGMDETHNLGRGKYLDEKGFTPQFELFTMHLNAVTKACVERGLKPMIWSDMFFRLGNSRREYYALDSNIPADVRAAIPEDVQLVYWDYYNYQQDFYEKFIEMHRELSGEPLMGAGLWIWSRLWYDHVLSGIANRACINGCRNRKLKEIFFTMWGDDGAICHWDSAWTGLTEASDLAYGVDDEDVTSQRYKGLTGSDYRINRLPGLMHRVTRQSGPDHELPRNHNSDLAIFWDDLLQGLGYRNMLTIDKTLPGKMLSDLQNIVCQLEPHKDDCGGGNLKYGWLLARYLRDKLSCRMQLLEAYAAGDKAALQLLADKNIVELTGLFEEVMQEFRKQWLACGKVFGLETMQHRMGGQKERLQEASRRIKEYLAGECAALEELEEPLLKSEERMVLYRDMASGSIWW